MKKSIYLLLFLTFNGFGQNGEDPFKDSPTIYRTEIIDPANNKAVKPVVATMEPRDKALIMVADEYVNNIMKNFYFWEGFFGDGTNTIYVYPNAKTSTDSVLVVRTDHSTYYFVKEGAKWKLTNFSILKNDFTLNYVTVGQESKEVFNRIGLKHKKKVEDGPVWILNKKGNYRFVFYFKDDKLVSMEL